MTAELSQEQKDQLVGGGECFLHSHTPDQITGLVELVLQEIPEPEPIPPGTYLEPANNLSDVASTATALANLGLDQVDNTSDLDKPVNTATSLALANKYDKAGGAISGDVSVAGTLTSDDIGTDSSSDLQLRTGGTVRVTVDASGNVGIGAAPVYKHHIEGSGGTYSLIKDSSNGVVGLLFGDSASNVVGRVQYTHSADTMQLFTGGSERLRIDADGNVGIGNSAPTAKLHVYHSQAGAPATSGSSDASISTRFQTANIALDIGVYGNGVTWLQNRLYNNFATNYSIALQPNGGNVGIGVAIPSAALEVAGISKLTNNGQLTASFNSPANSTNWIRICSFPSDNSPKYTRFLLISASLHLNFLVEFSPGAGGDNVRASITRLGTYSYFSRSPLQWRIVPAGTNSPSHLDIKFGGGAAVGYSIYVLEEFSPGAARPTYPCTDVGTTAAGYGITLGNTSAWTYREATLIPGRALRLSEALAYTSTAITINTVIT